MTISVNYVWMQKYGRTPGIVPPHLFYNLQQNAKRYSETEFCLWTQSPRAYRGYVLPPNITPCPLKQVESFSSIPLLQSDNPEHFWFKVDTARLLVLKYILGKRPDTKSVYCDFDVPDCGVASEMLHNRLNTYGVAFGGTFDADNPANAGASIETRVMHEAFENGYMAFTRKAEPLLDAIIDKIRHLRHPVGRDSVYFSIDNILCEWAKAGQLLGETPVPEDWRWEIAGFPIQPGCGWRGNTQLSAERVPSVLSVIKRDYPKKKGL